MTYEPTFVPQPFEFKFRKYFKFEVQTLLLPRLSRSQTESNTLRTQERRDLSETRFVFCLFLVNSRAISFYGTAGVPSKSQMDFYGMKRKQLQALCKKHKLPANLTNLKMAESLASVLKATNSQVVEGHGPKIRPCLKDSEDVLNRDSGGGPNDGEGRKELPKKVIFCLEKDQMYEYIDLVSDSDEGQSTRKGGQTRRSSRARPESLKTDTRTEEMGPVENTRSTRSRDRKSVGFPIVVQSPVDTNKTKRVAKKKSEHVERDKEHEKPSIGKNGVCEENEILRRSTRHAPKVNAPLVENKTEQPGRKNGRFGKKVSEKPSVPESEIPDNIESTGLIEEPRKRSRRNTPKGTVERETAELRDVVAADESKESCEPLNDRMAVNETSNHGTENTTEEQSSTEVQEPLMQSNSHAVSSRFGVPTAVTIGFTDEVERDDGHHNELTSLLDNTTVVTETESIQKNEEFLSPSTENISISAELTQRTSKLKWLGKSMLGEKHPLSGSKGQNEASKKSKREASEVFSAAEQEESPEKTGIGIVGLSRSQNLHINWNPKTPSETASENTDSIQQLEEVSADKCTELDGKTGDLVHLRSAVSQTMLSTSKNESEGEPLDESRNCTSNIISPVKKVTSGDGAFQLEISLRDDVVGEISLTKLDESTVKSNSGVLKEDLDEFGEVGGSWMKFCGVAQNNLVYSHADASHTKSRLEYDPVSTGQNEVETTESDISVRMEHREESVAQGSKEIHVESSRILSFDTCISVDKSNRMVNKDHSSVNPRVGLESQEFHEELSENLLFDSPKRFHKRNRVADEDHSSVKPEKIVDTIEFGLNESRKGSVEGSVVCESVSVSTEGLVIKENNTDCDGESILEEPNILHIDEPNLYEKEEHPSVSIYSLEQTDNIFVMEMTSNSAEIAVASKHPLTQAVEVNEEQSTANDLRPISLSGSVIEETTAKTEADSQVTFPTVGETKELTQTVSKEPHGLSIEEMSSRGLFPFHCAADQGYPTTPETHLGLGDESEDLKVILHGHKEHQKTDNHLAEFDEESMVLSESGRTGLDHGELQHSTGVHSNHFEETNSFLQQTNEELQDSNLVHTRCFKQTNFFATKSFEGDGEKLNVNITSNLKVVEVSSNNVVEESVKFLDYMKMEPVIENFESEEQVEQLVGSDQVELKGCPRVAQERLGFCDFDAEKISEKMLLNSDRKLGREPIDTVAEATEIRETDEKNFINGACEASSHSNVHAMCDMGDDIFAPSITSPTTEKCCQAGKNACVEIPTHEQTVSRHSDEESFSDGEKEETMVNETIPEDGLSPIHSVDVFIKEEFREAEFNENENATCSAETENIMRNQGCSGTSKGQLHCNLSAHGFGEKCKDSDGLKQVQALHEGLEIEENKGPKVAAIEEMEDHHDAQVVCTGEDCVENYHTVADEMAPVYKDDADNRNAKRKDMFATCVLDNGIAVEDTSEEVLCKNTNFLFGDENMNQEKEEYFFFEEGVMEKEDYFLFEEGVKEKEDYVCIDHEELGKGPVTTLTAEQHDLGNPEKKLTEEQDKEDDRLSSLNALFTTGETQNHDKNASLLMLYSEASANSKHQMKKMNLFNQSPSESLQLTKKSCSKVENKPLKVVENLKHWPITYEMKENTPAVKKERADNNVKVEKFTAPSSRRRPLEDLQHSRK
ncbi:hypothetical protein H6P81_015564 [Aristolochia fimbriata]|uniref:Uncharacterized protein n=1 Tax=Aristolochia fimbriata TaxID=158543 RepID=A0AAV7E6K1_ARIFI|nr:hypothetical protein H6P81_015564 [Aristolochia fimbriata]